MEGCLLAFILLLLLTMLMAVVDFVGCGWSVAKCQENMKKRDRYEEGVKKKRNNDTCIIKMAAIVFN